MRETITNILKYHTFSIALSFPVQSRNEYDSGVCLSLIIVLLIYMSRVKGRNCMNQLLLYRVVVM